MDKKRFRWEPVIISQMDTEAIEAKMKQLVPGFGLSEFTVKAEKYISYEDLSEEEYYPKAKFSEADEDFIWMACGELWKRLVPHRPAVEMVAQQVDSLIDEIIKAGRKKRWNEMLDRNREALDLICRYIIENTGTKPTLRLEFYEKLCNATIYDFESFLDDLIQNLIIDQEYERVIDIAGALAEGLGDDVFLDFKAESLFGLGRQDEAESLYQEIIGRNPDNPWLPIHAGDCFTGYSPKDLSKAKDYYLKALSIAQKQAGKPEDKDALQAVYQELIDLAYETDDHKAAAYYERLFNSLEAKKVGRNDPCPCGSGQKYKKCCGLNATKTPPEPPLDRRAMERDLLSLTQHLEGKDFGSLEEMNDYLDSFNQIGDIPDWVPETPLEHAQNLIYEALGTTGKERLELVEQALEISPDCADAYVLLAEEKAQTFEEALSLYEAGVKAGERALGKKTFQKQVGNFWHIIETRPYMRARTGMAQCLWYLGKHNEAIGHYYGLLRLNPNDNGGIRYLLAAALLEMAKIDELEKLLDKYDEPTAAWLYTRPLAIYIKQGDVPQARKLLKEAIDFNPNVVAYLLGRKKLPKELPERVGFGNKDEAIVYAFEFGSGWHQTEGAIQWLSLVSGKPPGKWQAGKRPVGIPDAFLRAFESEDKK